MIKANELRIGNILYSNLTERNFICNSEDIYNLAMDYNANNANYVELTEEWLLKFGFEKDEMHNCIVIYKDSYIHIEIAFECDIKIVTISGSEAGDHMEHIKYVHQLQNLYFALTGEELTIKNS